MTAAMMLPGAAAADLRGAHASGRVRAVALFVGSYLAVWILVGVAVYAVCRPHGTFAAGALAIGVLVLAQKLVPANAAIDLPLALAIVRLGILIVIAPSSVPGLTQAT